MSTTTVITLSRASRLTRLLPLPGQDPNRIFGVVGDGLPQPANGLGYVVEIVGARTVIVRAWIRVGMSLWACDTPLSEEPRREPDLTFLKDSQTSREGVVRLASTGSLDVARWTSGERLMRFSLELSESVIGSYAKTRPSLSVRTLAAVAWVALCEGRPAFVDALSFADALSILSRESLPDALDIIAKRAEREPALAHLAEELEAAGAASVRRICATHGAEGVYLHTTHLFWIRFDDERLSAEEQETLLAVEAAVNRAILAISWILDQDLGARPLDAELWAEGQRRAVTGILVQAPVLFNAHGEGNPRRSLFGTSGERGGEWDVRSRIAQMLEALRLPTRLPCRFDCNVEAGVATFEFALPAAALLGSAAGEPRSELRLDYALRLALVLCSVGFGASVGITRVRANCFSETLEGDPYLGLDLDRVDFAASVLPRLREDDALACVSPTELELLLEELGALRFGATLFEAEPLGLAERHGEQSMDDRPIPQPLADFLRADLVSDLYVYATSHDPLISEVARILEENRDSALVAVMELEGLLSRVDTPEEGPREPLYCSSGSDRLIVSLADGEPTTRYHAVRDVTYAAKLQLARLYLELGDSLRALEAAGECVRLAPTSPASHITLADIYARLERYDEAADELIRSLGLILTPSEADYVLYRLAFALWRTDRTQAAEAAYVVATEDPVVGPQAAMELAELRETCGFSGEYSIPAARVLLEAEGIPVPLSMELLSTLGRSVVTLTDLGVFDPTWQGLRILIPELGGDDLANLLRSIKDGTPRTP